ncbi:MAG: protein kinase [Myxococcales bacterium]|nr:protein kinase [Myxococcales bacterium]
MHAEDDLPPIPLGEIYHLHDPLGRGAMGEVWRGTHKPQGLPVAVKILTRRDTLDARYEIGFREEVRAAASLDHPNIVTVYDYGRTDQKTEEWTNGRYPVGSPYLVMELVEGMSLRQLCGRLAWPTLANILLGLLDALGHAHARGLIHRDLKPHNVMVTPDEAGALTVKLTDFGLAHATRPDAANPFLERMAGTPNYMAPEQVMVAWRDYGPWTDLYALGCLAHALATGRPPFAGRGSRAILKAHLEDPPPPLVADVPDGFCRWVDRLLEKEPDRRYACAADAAWALMQVLEGGEPLSGRDAKATRLDFKAISSSDKQLDASVAVSGVRHTLNWDLSELSQSASVSFLPGREVPPVPGNWRRVVEEVAWNPMVGAGLGLWGLRSLPLVGREHARDRLWDLLTEVHADGRPRGAVIEGPPGFGKTRLVHWLAERASEYGVAQVVEITHSAQGSPKDGLVPGFARFHQCHGLDRGEATDRMARILRHLGEHNEERWHQIGDLLAESDADTRPISPRQRRRILLDHLRRLSRARPVILLVDDAQWADDALDFARSVLASREELHVLVVLTSDGSAHVTGAERVVLEPLDAEQMTELVQSLLGLVGEVAQAVERRAEGNPLFAIQLVGDWVQRGELQATPQGFRRPPGVKIKLPDSIHAIWLDRLDALLGEAAQDWRALELAAVLGQRVAMDEWAAACRHAGVHPTEDLVEVLIEGGLATRTLRERDHWAFAHGLLHQSMLRLVREGGRGLAHHAACGVALAGFRKRPGVSERQARHLLAAGDDAAALEPLIDAAWARLKASEHDRAQALYEQWRNAVMRLDLPPDDAQRAAGLHLKCRIARTQGELKRARQLAEAAEAEARRHNWWKVLARTLVDRGWDAFNEGDLQLGLDRMAEGARIAQQHADSNLQANSLRNQAVLQLDRDPARVRSLLEEARAVYAAQNHPQGLALTAVNHAQLARRQGQYAQAEAWLDEADRHFLADHTRWGHAMVLAERGLVRLLAGDLAGAEELLQEAVQRYQVLGGVNAPLAKLNLAELRLAQGKRDEAWGLFAGLREKLGQHGRHGRTLHATLGLLAVAADDEDWESWDETVDLARPLVEDHLAAGRDAIRLAEQAAQAALRRGEPRRAAQAWDLAQVQWQALGAADEVTRVQAERARADALGQGSAAG